MSHKVWFADKLSTKNENTDIDLARLAKESVSETPSEGMVYTQNRKVEQNRKVYNPLGYVDKLKSKETLRREVYVEKVRSMLVSLLNSNKIGKELAESTMNNVINTYKLPTIDTFDSRRNYKVVEASINKDTGKIESITFVGNNEAYIHYAGNNKKSIRNMRSIKYAFLIVINYGDYVDVKDGIEFAHMMKDRVDKDFI